MTPQADDLRFGVPLSTIGEAARFLDVPVGDIEDVLRATLPAAA